MTKQRSIQEDYSRENWEQYRDERAEVRLGYYACKNKLHNKMHNHHIHYTVVVLQSDFIENNLTSKHMTNQRISWRQQFGVWEKASLLILESLLRSHLVSAHPQQGSLPAHFTQYACRMWSENETRNHYNTTTTKTGILGKLVSSLQMFSNYESILPASLHVISKQTTNWVVSNHCKACVVQMINHAKYTQLAIVYYS